jgi:type I restriction enzyme S subunit
VSELPKGWAWATVGDLAEYINGFAFKPTDRSVSGLPIIRIQNLTDPDRPVHLTQRRVPDEYRVRTGDILVSWSATLDAFRWGRGEALVNQHIFKVVPNSVAVHAPWLLHWLRLAIVQMQDTEHLHGSTMKHINRGPFLAHRVPLPPLKEQVRIASALEDVLSDLDAGVDELKTAQAKLQRYRQSLLKAAVQGDLTSDWRAANPPAETGAALLQRILAERRARWEAAQRAKAEASGKPLAKGWQAKYEAPSEAAASALPQLPPGWAYASADQLSWEGLANGRSVPTAEAGAKVLRLTAIRRGQVDLAEHKCGDWTAAEAKPFSVTKGDLLIVRGNGSLQLVGRCGLVGDVPFQVAYPDTLIRLRVMTDLVAPAWLAAVWDSQLVRSHLEGRARTSAGIYKIAQPDIQSAPVPVPPAAESLEALRLLHDQLEVSDAMQSAIDKSLARCTAQRQNILRAAFAGQLVPQDPADEPAEVLLARLRSGRAPVTSGGRRR